MQDRGWDKKRVLSQDAPNQQPSAPIHSPAVSAITPRSISNIPNFAPQTKLSVNTPGDQYEVEADSMADQVMTMTDSSVQRSSDEDGSSFGDVSGVVDDGLSGGGQPLDEDTRSFMEPRFGVNFSDVRIHTDSKASQSSEAMAARAYAVGPNIAFKSGEYSPGSSDGKRLLAHELTHVVQQTGS
jgi:hypothetical protein